MTDIKSQSAVDVAELAELDELKAAFNALAALTWMRNKKPSEIAAWVAELVASYDTAARKSETALKRLYEWCDLSASPSQGDYEYDAAMCDARAALGIEHPKQID